MNYPNLSTPPDQPAGLAPHDPPTELIAAARRPRRWNLMIGAALVALLVVAGAAIALLVPNGDPARVADVGGLSDVDQLSANNALPAVSGPGDDPATDRVGRRRGLGDDTLLIGRLVTNDGGTLVVAQDGGPERTIRTDGNTAVRGFGNKAVADLEPGERVLVRVHGTGDGAVAVGVGARLARATGTVSELSGDTATLVHVDGTTETVNVAKVNPKPAVGDLVLLVGPPTNGAPFSAERIRILPKFS